MQTMTTLATTMTGADVLRAGEQITAGRVVNGSTVNGSAVNDCLMDKHQWREAWSRHLATYQGTFPRTGFHLEMLFPDRSLRFLELGGATLRDANYLAQRGYDVVGSDYEAETVRIAARACRNPALKTMVLDAFATGLPDKSFDVTFHNGLWVCFKSDEQIAQLLREQARITAKYLVVLVHNGHNQLLRRTFAERAKADRLYDIRFFDRPQVSALLEPYGRTTFYAFGTRLSNRLAPGMALGWLPYALRTSIYRHVCPHEPLATWERLLAVTEVR